MFCRRFLLDPVRRGALDVKGRPKEAMSASARGWRRCSSLRDSDEFAPIGIGAAIAVTVGHSGVGVLVNLGKMVLTLYGALIVFVLVALVPVALLARVPLRAFIRMVKEPALIAFATTSSEAALPKAMENMERLGVPRRIVAFVIPTGYSFNLDGSTLYLAVASIFVAQAAGVHLSWGSSVQE